MTANKRNKLPADKPEVSIGRVLPPDQFEVDLVDQIAKKHLGDQARARFMYGAMARGVKGDSAFYGYPVVIIDPTLGDQAKVQAEYFERVTQAAIEIGNVVESAANVTLDVTGDLLRGEDIGKDMYPTTINPIQAVESTFSKYL